MRIRGVQLVGLAVALAGVAAEDARAGDVNITTATTTPLQTSSPDAANPGPGNVTIAAAGSITVTAGQTAVTVDTNNSVLNTGTITSNNANGTVGIRINDGIATNVTNSGVISLIEDYTATNPDNDLDFDGPWAQGTDKVAIWQTGDFTGNITHNTGGAISVEATNGVGIRVDGLLTGNILSNGAIGIFGDNSRAIAINGGAAGGVTGNVAINGNTQVRGEGGINVLVDAPITGALTINGTHTTSAYFNVTHPTNQDVIDDLDPDDLRQSGSFLALHSSVDGGVVIQGIGVEDDDDDDGDGVAEDATTDPDTNDDLTASITVYSGAPAIWIAPNATNAGNLVLGTSGFGFTNRGSVLSSGVFDGFDTTAIRVEGFNGATSTITGGLRNHGTLGVLAYEADAYAIYVGDDAIVPTIINRKTINSRSTSDTMQGAYGIYIASGANVASIDNSGVITAQLLGEIGNAAVITDRSNTLATITNTGGILAQIVPTDSDITDDVFPVVTGNAIAIDLSQSTIALTINQNPDVVYNDDDTTDDDVNNRPAIAIVGDILLGSGADTVNINTGTVLGDIAFGAGADELNINGGALVVGRLSDTDGNLDINVTDGRLGVSGSQVNISNAVFGAESELGVTLSTTPAESTLIVASGTVSFAAGAKITPVIPRGLPASGTHTFLTAQGGLTGASNVTRTITGTGAPWLYNTTISVVQNDANSLQAGYVLKSTQELGLNANQSNAFDPVLAALRGDDEASFAFANLVTEEDFFDAYADLMPNYAGAAAELATTAIQQGQSASTNRLATTRLRDVREVSVWAQEIGYGLERTPETFGVKYRGSGFGFAAGIDGPLDNGALFGISGAFIASEVEEPGRVDGEIAAQFGQVNAYLGTAMGAIDLDFVGGAGVGQMRSRRFVAIGEDFERTAEAEWWAYEAHGAIRASAPMRAGGFVFTPQAALNYVVLGEQAYTEEGGGDAINYDVDDTVSQRLWADAGVEFSARLGRAGETQVFPRLYLGYRANVIDEASERTVRFVSGGDDFTLIDETTGAGGPLLGLGIDATNGFSTFAIGYEGEFGDQLQRHSLNASLRFRF